MGSSPVLQKTWDQKQTWLIASRVSVMPGALPLEQVWWHIPGAPPTGGIYSPPGFLGGF